MMACACFSENAKRRDQRFARLARQLGGADQADDFVEIVERLLEAEQDVLALAGFAQFVLGAPADHIDAVIDEVLDHVHQAELARLAVDDGEHDDAEADLQLCVLIQVVEDDLGLLAALQFDDDAHAVAVAVVHHVGDAFDALLVDHGGDLFEQLRLVDLIGDLVDDDLLAILAHLLDLGAGANLQLAAAGGVGLLDALPAEDEAAGGEIGTLDDFEQLGEMSPRDAGSCG